MPKPKLEQPQLQLEYVEPLEGESLPSYFHRFRYGKGNRLSTPSWLTQEAGIGPVLARWERFQYNPYPNRKELKAVGSLIGISPKRLAEMLPPESEEVVQNTIRFCAACYLKHPCHQMKWQLRSTEGCDQHQLRLLSKCPGTGCRKKFSIQSILTNDFCEKCGMPYKRMVKYQKAY
ncbi:TniQ family protein [Geitlerinema sp. PCC 7407]|uniref:TniQ family protein n=1 Tax=Geitlerinema sp. PCC 7407 TaxID=1173025 RepID=UPI00029F99E3|nr:TniQ family protein [Geitlerinema sp. PCC 7407]AFY67291.1 hypothetical protein GEI7407_2820 [Geitlerinema sp. PCC 7407]